VLSWRLNHTASRTRGLAASMSSASRRNRSWSAAARRLPDR
jgi:hypothetical protein